MSRGREMAALVGLARQEIMPLIGCSVCATGLATDMVGELCGEEPYDWRGERFGHDCPIAKNGVPADKMPRLMAIKAALEVPPGLLQQPIPGTT